MKVVLVMHEFPSNSPFLLAKFTGLLYAGVDVHLVCGAGKGRRVPKTWGGEQRVWPVWPTRSRLTAAVLWPFVVLRCLFRNPAGTWRYLRQGKRRWGWRVLRQLYVDAEVVGLRPDVIHFEFGTLAKGRLHLGAWLGARTVVSFRGYDLNYVGLEDPAYYQEVWQHADMLHLLGRDLWRRAVRRGCPSHKPHRLIPPAIDTDFFAPQPRSHPEILAARPLRIVSVGRLVWKKGYEYAIQAMRQLEAQGIPFEYRIAGDGAYAEPVLFALHEAGLQDRVALLGGLGRDALKEQLQWADVFLHPAVSEGFCNAVIEAQSMRLPIVCTDADGLAENVVEGKTGFVVPTRDARALADALAVLARDAGLRETMGEAGRLRAVRAFRIEEQVTAFQRLYRDAAERARPPKDEHPVYAN